ncbi:SDR family oxidoreductase [Fulvivirga maritima]|uniref:SDR family oxidoreductase n=1 Tax=Fulvivirga maritima TaxID=2904247 RepID=UPI001F418070|nr:SDR family oxidoreductase [Fulvivirga maritima]UII26371.1 SDR family oxidoreductase [Fulvivirga maritima]
MKKVLIIGANGKIGKILTNKMKEAEDFSPVAMIRKEEQKSYFKDLGVETKLVSLEGELDDIESAVKGLDAVVFTAGSGGSTGQDKTLTVDLDGAVKTMEAAKANEVKRFVIVSALGADDRSFWDKSGIKPYYVAKHFADRTLKTIGLDYTIIRPGMLKDDAGTGKITLEDPMSAESVQREDVAEVILTSLRQDNTIGKVIEFNNGDKNIEEAVASI